MKKEEVLALLQKSQDYLSGQELSEIFGVSRTAVWKAIRLLKREGYEIVGVQNRGYRLVSSPDLLTKEMLAELPGIPWEDGELVLFSETDSTNLQATLLSEKKAPNGTIVIAEQQNAGRGRRGRNWQSPKGEGLYFSLLLYPELPPSKVSMLTLVMAMAICRAIRQVTNEDARIKWPNDIVLHGRKIVGILTEMRMEADLIREVVIGCGLNINNVSFSEDLADKATSLRIETGKRWDRAAILSAIMVEFRSIYDEVQIAGNLNSILEEYNSLLVNFNAVVRVLDPKEEYTGFGKGIDAEGNLLVEREEGTIASVYAGEVSVRGIYGYV